VPIAVAIGRWGRRTVAGRLPGAGGGWLGGCGRQLVAAIGRQRGDHAHQRLRCQALPEDTGELARRHPTDQLQQQPLGVADQRPMPIRRH
jgi:hypothetical protein